MSSTRIPSPARSVGAPRTPKRQKSTGTRSVGSPARSNTSGRLTSVIQSFKDKNMDSFVLSPIPSRRSLLTDVTDIDEPRRKSWWKNLGEHSRDVMEVLEHNDAVEMNVVEDLDVEILSQEQKNYTLDLPDSSDAESISSIVIPQRKLFTQKDNQQQNKYGHIIGRRESMAKLHKTHIENEKPIQTKPKNLFGQASKQRTKPVFPAELLKITPDKTINKTKENAAEMQGPPRNLFGNVGMKRKNMFADFIVSDSEDDISEIQPKVFGFQKKVKQDEKDTRQVSASHGTKVPSPTSSLTKLLDISEDWKLLPSSTMVQEMEMDDDNGELGVLAYSDDEPSEGKDTLKNNDVVEENECEDASDEAQDGSNETIRKEHDDIETLEHVSQKVDENRKVINEKPCIEDQINEKINESNLRNISKKSVSKRSEETNISTTQEMKNQNAKEIHNENNQNKIKDQEKSIIEAEHKINKSHNRTKAIEMQNDDIILNAENNSSKHGNTLQIEQEKNQENLDVHTKLDVNISVKNRTLNKSQKKQDPNEVEQLENNDNNKENVSEGIENSTVDENEDERQNASQNNSIDQSQEREDESINKKNDSNEVAIENQDDENIESENEDIQNEDNVIENSEETEIDENVESDSEIHEASDENINEENENIEVSQEVSEESESKNDTEEVNDEDQEENHEVLNNDQESEEEQQDDEDEEQDDNEVDNSEIHIENEESNNENQVHSKNEQVNESQQNQEDQEDDMDDEENQEDMVMNDDEQDGNQSINESQDNEDQEDQEQVTGDEKNQEEDHEEEEEHDMVMSGDEQDEETGESADEVQEVDQNESGSDTEGPVADEINEPKSEQESPNQTHDTTGRNRRKDSSVKSPEAVLHDVSNNNEFSTAQGRNTSVRKTKSLLRPNIRPSLAPPRESTGFSDGTKNSSAEGSGWDSHRVTKKTLRQTFGKDFTPRKSLRALVMEKSAKRHTNFNDPHMDTIPMPRANSTEYADATNHYENDENVHEVTNHYENDENVHEVSKRTRQTTLETYLQKIKKDNLEKKKKMEEAIRNSLRTPASGAINLFKVPARPNFTRTNKTIAKSKSKPISAIPLECLPEELIEDMKYKPPKRFKPGNAGWITKRLYKYLESKLEAKYDYKARVRAEKLVETIYNFTKDIRRHQVAPYSVVDVLKHEMARLSIVKTHHDFYGFIHEFMPRDVRVKVVPDVVNKIPLPRHGPFSDILREANVQG